MKNKCFYLLFLLFSFLSISVYAQVKVEGNVFDENGSPLIGVSVFTEGQKTGTVTNVDGHFTIMVPNTNSSLTFSYVGYMTQKIQLRGKKNSEDCNEGRCRIIGRSCSSRLWYTKEN